MPPVFPCRYVVMMNAYNRIPDNPFAVRASLKRGAAVRRKQSRQTFPSNRLLDSTYRRKGYHLKRETRVALTVSTRSSGPSTRCRDHLILQYTVFPYMSLVITCDGRLPSDTYPHTDELFAVRASFKHGTQGTSIDIPDAVPVGSVTFESRIQNFDYTFTIIYHSSTVILGVHELISRSRLRVTVTLTVSTSEILPIFARDRMVTTPRSRTSSQRQRYEFSNRRAHLCHASILLNLGAVRRPRFEAKDRSSMHYTEATGMSRISTASVAGQNSPLSPPPKRCKEYHNDT
ncbi:hypothetical protein C8R42DRAFT_131303 [Lentinula raphanica]|nr:hypothetical protein C8R42DRAFT_131303 [Lentinula raphanica]